MIGLPRVVSLALAGLLLFPLATVRAQQGDKKGEVQTLRVSREKIPPAPPLSPEAAQRQFQTQPGFRIELVASEPMVENPTVLQFDPEGRLWVLEMRGFMPNADGIGETNPVGRISILEDTDGDGRMDRSRVFLDGLVMPRAMLLVKGGVLVCAPPQLWFYPNEQDRAGRRELVAPDFAKEGDPALGPRMNCEHTGNSLLRNIDNWIYSLYHPFRYRFRDGRWQREPMPQRVQWGLAQDDFGRLFYTSNSDQLRGDLVPSHYFLGKMGRQKLPGIGIQIARDQTVWPSRVNPGVNRGYQPDTLRADGTLFKFTAACGSTIYRGDWFPPGFYGNAFVCEPAANLVRRNVLTEQDGGVTAKNAYEKEEFLTSKDELFRPVNLATGPDGALYIADMYHGIIQHKVYLTSYLRGQAEDRGLQNVTQHGRIWRVVPETKKNGARPHLSTASSRELVQALGHANGWWRDTAQRLLVDRGDASVAGDLEKLARSEAGPVTRLHALWTLEGLRPLGPSSLEAALNDPAPKVRAAGIRLAEPALRGTNSSPAAAELRNRVVQLAADPSADVQLQAALTLGLLLPEAKSKETLAGLARSATSALARDVASFGLASLEPPKADALAVDNARPLTPEEKQRFDAGKTMYEATCLACHQVHGMGQAGLAPPLLGSEWAAGSDERLIRIVINGLRGPIKVKGETFELDMPALGVLDDDQIAAVLTYVRREWTHRFEPVTPAKVKKVREATASREDAWTMVDLLKVP
jgi:mono/diheme cytochrome c family protein/glucose/arabinose dehydrogenase